MKNKKRNYSKKFEEFSNAVTKATGKPSAFLMALCVIIVWAMSGPFFHFSDTWQLVVNTSTTIITFLMVFVIQQSQNKETMALQLKMNELIAANKDASNRLIVIEDLTEVELMVIKKFYITLSELSHKETELFSTHSLDEASHNHIIKHRQLRIKKSF